MKELARWLYIKTHQDELAQVAKMVRGIKAIGDPVEGMKETGRALGALKTLETLNLFV